METVELERFKYIVQMHISDEVLDKFANPPDIKISDMVHYELDGLTIQLRQEILGRTMQRIEYPRDWWQAFKARWFPAWAKRKWPVQMVRYEVREFYPQVKLPDRAHNVRFCKMGAYDDGYSESRADTL